VARLKVKMIRSTYSAEHGGELLKDKLVDVDEKTAERWIKKYIAVADESEKTNAELYEECIAKGLEVAKGKAKQYYLDALKGV
jgi:hypothetical protein